MTDGFVFDFQRFRSWIKGSKKRFIGMMAVLAVVLSAVAMPVVAQDDGGGGTLNPFSDDFLAFKPDVPFDERKDAARGILDGYGCFSCEIFGKFSTSVFSVSGNVDAAGATLIPALIGFTTVFTFFYLGSAFVAGDASDLPGRWQVIWRLYLAATAGSIFLGAPLTYSWDYIFAPLFSIGTGVVNMMGGLGGASCTGAGAVSGAPAGANDALQSMSQTVCGAYDMTKDGIATGMALATQTDGIINSLINGATGIAVILIYGFIAIIFPLRFIDVVIRLAIVGMITPILGLFAVFKPTRGYVMIAISNVLNATAQFAIMSIMFIVGAQVFNDVISNSGFGIEPTGDGSDSLSVLMNAFIIIGVAFVFTGMLKAVPGIAAEFSRFSGSGSDVGSSAVGKLAAGTAVIATAGGAATKVALSKGASGAAGVGRAGAAGAAGKAAAGAGASAAAQRLGKGTTD